MLPGGSSTTWPLRQVDAEVLGDEAGLLHPSSSRYRSTPAFDTRPSRAERTSRDPDQFSGNDRRLQAGQVRVGHVDEPALAQPIRVHLAAGDPADQAVVAAGDIGARVVDGIGDRLGAAPRVAK